MGSSYVKLSDQIRRMVESCGQTRYAISKATGIDQSTLSRFANGERGLPMATLDRLGEYLHLHITIGRSRRGKGK